MSLASLYGLPVITSKYLPAGTVLIADVRGPLTGAKHDLLIIDDLTSEKLMATAIKNIRVNVYDGPHHGRILIVPSNVRHFVLPNPMPAGEMWGPGRSNPASFTDREYNYEKRVSGEGKPYLAYVEAKRSTFQIPPAPKPVVKLSATVSDLLQKVTDLAYNVGVGSNGTRAERVAMLHAAERKLGEYVSNLEREMYPPIYQGRSHTFDA